MELDAETYCHGCGAPLAWRITRSLPQLTPLDIEPSEDGTVRVDDDNSATILAGPALARARAQRAVLYARHIQGQDCPDLWPAQSGEFANEFKSEIPKVPSFLAFRPPDTTAPTSLFPDQARQPGVGTPSRAPTETP
ncbi:hypothetical protein [Nocardia sp. XZ_19_385]|uniref:hypothetical protein n=1 Tax=Nocardia sp. XZ_19_385 TaxID=2769488 RepID=UPI00188F172F|nr:hypothetical protein [Nocardia sp. XZ_19_385]